MTDTQEKTWTREIVIAKGPGIARLVVEIEVRDTDKGPELSMCGNETGPRGRMESAGQLRGYIRELLAKSDRPGWSWSYPKAAIERLCDIGDLWHLNGMRPGCEHQRAERWSERPIDPSKPTNAYGRHFPGQREDSWNMLAWVRRDEHPKGLLSHPCATCGYRYGSAWLHEPLPEQVVDELKAWPSPIAL